MPNNSGGSRWKMDFCLSFSGKRGNYRILHLFMTPPVFPSQPPARNQTPMAAAMAVFITVFLITVIIATAITFILPESFAGTCRIKVEQNVSQGTNVVTYDPYFLQTEFEVMQSQLVLEPVIARLNLDVEWGKKYFNGETLKTSEAMEILKARLRLAPVRGTKLIAITVYSDDRNEAARLANAIADSYWAYRMGAAGKVDVQSQANPPVHIEKFGAAGHQQNEIERKLPVVIYDRAEPGRFPVKPNKPLNIVLGVVIGIFLGGLSGGLVWGFNSRRR